MISNSAKVCGKHKEIDVWEVCSICRPEANKNCKAERDYPLESFPIHLSFCKMRNLRYACLFIFMTTHVPNSWPLAAIASALVRRTLGGEKVGELPGHGASGEGVRGLPGDAVQHFKFSVKNYWSTKYQEYCKSKLYQ